MNDSAKRTTCERRGCARTEGRRPVRPPDKAASNRLASLKKAKSLVVLTSLPTTPSRTNSLPHIIQPQWKARGSCSRERQLRLAWRGYSAFLINVMRKRKSKLERASSEAHYRDSKLQRLMLQVETLREILEKDDIALHNKSKEIALVRRKAEELNYENVRLKQMEKEASQTVHRLRESLEDSQQDLATAKTSEGKLRAEASDLHLLLLQETGKSSLLTEENTSLAMQIDSLRKNFDEKLEKMEELDVSVGNLKNIVEMQQKAIKCAREQKNDDDLLVKNYLKEVQQLNMELCHLVKENTHFRDEIARLRQLTALELAAGEGSESCRWPEPHAAWRLVRRVVSTLLYSSGPHPLSYQPPSNTPLFNYLSSKNFYLQ